VRRCSYADSGEEEAHSNSKRYGAALNDACSATSTNGAAETKLEERNNDGIITEAQKCLYIFEMAMTE
jgi:hypothetical protein